MQSERFESLVILMIEHDQPEGLSARKLVVETAKHNVLTAYTREEGLRLLQRFPKVDAVLVHAMLPRCEELIAEVLSIAPDVPVIVAAPVMDHGYPGASFVVPSHEPTKLLALLAREFHVSISN